MDVKVDRSTKGWEVSVTPMSLTPKGQEIFGVKDMVWLFNGVSNNGHRKLMQLQSLHQMHRDVVYDYPPEVEQLAYSPRCDVQGMYIKNRLITVQGHPEFTHEIVDELLRARHDSGVFDDGMYEDGMDRVGKKHDGVVVSKAFIKFLMDD